MLFSRPLPLIRYEMSDSVGLAADPRCGCGRPYRLLDAIQGREQDALVSRPRRRRLAGRAAHRKAPLIVGPGRPHTPMGFTSMPSGGIQGRVGGRPRPPSPGWSGPDRTSITGGMVLNTTTTTGTTSRTYLVEGMTCDHCVAAVRGEIGNLDAVQGVHVELVPGGTSRVTVTSTTALSDEQVRVAVDEAGYELAERSR